MEKPNQVTVKDVARRAGVSPGTVSNALSGKRPVSAAAKTRIFAAIAELDYQPNLLARSLVSRRSATVAVIASGLDYYGPSRTLAGIEEQANAYGYSLLLTLIHEPAAVEVEPVLREITARRVDGIIWAIPEIGANHGWIDGPRPAGLPPTVFLTMAQRRDVVMVATDNCAGGRLATEHLLNQGLTRIGLITGPLSWWEARERRRGWAQALAAHGRTDEQAADHPAIYEGTWRAASGGEGVRTLLQRLPALEGLVVGNDQMALGALRAAHSLGRRVPDDLAIVGYDNMPEAPFFWPSLTSVRQQLREIGHLAVDELHRQIQQQATVARAAGGPPPRQHVLAPELVIRESSQLPRAS